MKKPLSEELIKKLRAKRGGDDEYDNADFEVIEKKARVPEGWKEKQQNSQK